MTVRPVYETQAHLDEERRIAERLEAYWHCSVVKLPRAYNLDFAAVRNNQLLGWLEVKRRNRTLRQHRCVFLSMQKVRSGYELNLITGKPCYFVVQFDDCLAYTDIATRRAIEFRGRTDRSDWQDQEPIVSIDPDEFTLIGEPA